MSKAAYVITIHVDIVPGYVDIEFERPCPKCAPKYSTWEIGKGCDECDETGLTLTDEGVRLLEFLERRRKRLL